MYVEFTCINCGTRFKRADYNIVENFPPKFCSRLCISLHKRKPSVIKKRFWSKVSTGGEYECWEWTDAVFHGSGYGSFSYYRTPSKQRRVIAHRLAYRITKGKIPKGLVVCHTCDNKLCCNPRHLWLGTQEANLADMKMKGRSGRGEKQWKARLAESDIKVIRQMLANGVLHRRIAQRFGVSRSTITYINAGKSWRHVKRQK